MAEWKKFTGSEKQIEELSNAKHGWIIRTKDGSEHGCVGANIMLDRYIHDAEEYFICNPHPHAEMIKRWADTGQPVYCKNVYGEWREDVNPDWNPKTEYSFNPPKEKKFIEVKEYLCKSINDGSYYTATITKGARSDSVTFTEQRKIFVRWIDEDWRKVEI